jgi:hypothetical protein
MVDTFGPSAPTPPEARRRRFHIGGGRFRTFSSDTSRGSATRLARQICSMVTLAKPPLMHALILVQIDMVAEENANFLVSELKQCN